MPAPWTQIRKQERRLILFELYVKQNKSISEIAKIDHCNYVTIYNQLRRLEIPIQRHLKPKNNNKRTDVVIPKRKSAHLAEFIGIMLGDGHLSPTQVTVSLGTKDEYIDYLVRLFKKVFNIQAKVMVNGRRYKTVYFGSTEAVRWLGTQGLVSNKVRSQVNLPEWIYGNPSYARAALRGLLDTDGSIYLLSNGRMQVSFCNRSLPLLMSVRKLFECLDFHPSRVSGYNVFLTRKAEIGRLYQEVGFNNLKHRKRYRKFVKEFRWGGRVAITLDCRSSALVAS